MFRRILLASDGSPCALKAASTAAEIASRFGACVTILHVVTLPTSVMPLLAGADAPVAFPDMDRDVEAIVDAVTRRTGKALEERNIAYEVKHEVGNPAAEIARVAEEGHYDLIVLGSRGLSGVTSFLLGSVSDRVTHHAHCPVLIVR